MQGPSFQSFKKETIHNPLLQSNFLNNKTHFINKEESNSIPLFINRNSENFAYPIFQIVYPSLKDEYKSSIITYVQSILKINIVNSIDFDCLTNYSTNNYNKDTIYIFDFTNNSIKNTDINGDSLGLFIFSILDKVGGIIAIGKSIDDFPKSFSTLSSVVFLDKHMPELQKTIATSSFIRLNNNVILEEENICIDKLSLTTKITSFCK